MLFVGLVGDFEELVVVSGVGVWEWGFDRCGNVYSQEPYGVVVALVCKWSML